MVRRIAALFFLVGMMTLVLFQQPVLAYCAHSEQFFLNDCGCAEPVETSCPHCPQDQPEQPCDDCSEKIQLNIDDLIWSDLAFDPPGFSNSSIAQEAEEALPLRASSRAEGVSIRPPPLPQAAPLFLLHSVFRL